MKVYNECIKPATKNVYGTWKLTKLLEGKCTTINEKSFSENEPRDIVEMIKEQN